jgi:DNA (cytosine-5)-methyltransferase 1
MTFRVLDLFAGCGGLSYGLRSSGHSIVAAIERDQWAAETFAANMPEAEVICDDIRNLDSSVLKNRFGSKIDTVVGGPPCQGFSVSGKRQYGIYKPENQLVYEFIRVVEVLRPKFFILENVRGFASATIEGRTKALNEILKKLRTRGYKITHRVLQAAEHGVPQYRSRLFVIGSLDGFVEPLQPNHKFGNESAKCAVLEAINDLPTIHAGEGSDGPQPYTDYPKSEYAKLLRKGSKLVYNHEAMKHSLELVRRFAKIPPGGKGYDLGRKSHDGKTVTIYKSNNQRLIGDLPSLCITANWQSSYIHPVLNRNLTVREAARIQSFPDNFVFRGKRALMSSSLLRREGRHAELHISQCHQVGNAVPPMLAEQLGRHLEQLEMNGDLSSVCLKNWM